MLIGFVIWSLVCLCLLGIGVYAFLSKKPVSFWTGTKLPEVRDTKGYNRSVGILWTVYALVMEAMGIPILFMQQNSAGFVVIILGSVAASIGLMAAYVLIEKKWKV